MKVINLTSGEEVADRIEVASTFFQRLSGLIPRKSLEKGHGLWITPCSSIHTFMMRFPIDVVYISETGFVIGTEEHLLPNRVGKRHTNVAHVLELPAGAVKEKQININDQLRIVNN